MSTHPNKSSNIALMAGTLLALAGCGAEVAGGAAVVGGLQAQQLRQAQQQQDQVVDGLKAAQAAGVARAASAGD